MSERDEIQELMDPATWESDEQQVHEPVEGAEAVVPVRLNREDLAAIERYARSQGITIPRALRHAALDWIRQHQTDTEESTGSDHITVVGFASSSHEPSDVHVKLTSGAFTSRP